MGARIGIRANVVAAADGLAAVDVDKVSDLALVRSMSQMGQALGKVTIAEWVESEAVMAQLREVGIGYVQGYAVHVPCPLADLALVDEAVAEPA